MSYRAMVIEDDHALADVLRMKLTRDGHEVSIASSQREAYHLLDEQEFDFVLLDLRLPTHDGDMNPNSQVGFDVLDHIRDRFAQDELPVVVMTAYEESSQTAVRALKALANDYITKPFEDSPVSLDKKLTAIVRSIEIARRSPDAKRKNKIVFTKAGVQVNGFTVVNPRLADLLRLLGSRTLMLSGDRSNSEDPRMTGKEIADAMGVKDATVRQYVKRFREWIAAEHDPNNKGSVGGQDIIRNTRDWKGYDLNFETCYISRE